MRGTASRSSGLRRSQTFSLPPRSLFFSSGCIAFDWRKEQQSRAAVRLAVEQKLDELPEKYDRELFEQKCEVVYLHIFDSYG